MAMDMNGASDGSAERLAETCDENAATCPVENEQDCRKWAAGMVTCRLCGHKWAAVAPVCVRKRLQCPNCEEMTGVAADVMPSRPGRPQ